MLAVVGYAYGVSSLYKLGPFSSMALHTAAGFFIFCLALLAANPGCGIGSLFTSASAGGDVARKLIPTIPVALFVLGWLRLIGQKLGYYDTQFGLALMVMLSSAVAVLSISMTAVSLRKIDFKRKRAEADYRELNSDLELRVAERTQELARLSTELSTANAALEQASMHDSLTGLANRRFFDAYLATQVAISKRHRRPLSLVLCDIDYFKDYNDEFGHQAGDGVLQQVAAVLGICCRRPADMAARYGGEEFVLVLPDTDRTGALLIAESARLAVEDLRIVHGDKHPGAVVTISSGVSELTAEIDFCPKLILAADRALYEAKDRGRNRVLFGGGPSPVALAIEGGVAFQAPVRRKG